MPPKGERGPKNLLSPPAVPEIKREVVNTSSAERTGRLLLGFLYSNSEAECVGVVMTMNIAERKILQKFFQTLLDLQEGVIAQYTFLDAAEWEEKIKAIKKSHADTFPRLDPFLTEQVDAMFEIVERLNPKQPQEDL